jgi:hypothetical protein
MPWSAKEHDRGVDSDDGDDDDEGRPIMRPIMSKRGVEQLIWECDETQVTLTFHTRKFLCSVDVEGCRVD